MSIRLILFSTVVFMMFACQNSKKEKEKENRKTACEFCVDSSGFKPLSNSYRRKITPQIEEYYSMYFDSLGFNGGFLVAKNGQVLYERYDGFADKEKKQLMKPATALHIASVSKVLTATAIFRLVETKKIQLDQKVKSVLPEFPYPRISIRMLLNHRSGVPKYANFSEPDSIWGVEKVLHNDDILDLLAKHKFPLDFVPDTKFVYNNSNFAILALVVEKKVKMPFKKAMQELVFEPLGMTNTFVFTLEEDKDEVSQSYSTRFKLQEFDNLDAVYGDKNIYSTPRDLLKYDLAMQKNDFISKKLKKEIYKGYSYERPGIKNYGLGIRLKEWEDGKKIFFHNGWWHGNRASYVTMKKEGVTLIAMTNSNTRKVYSIVQLSVLFGDYPFGIEEDKELEVINVDQKMTQDTILEAPLEITE